VASSEGASFTLASTPAEQIPVIQGAVTELVNIGVLLPGDGQPLQAKLNAALDAVNRGNSKATIDSLNAFDNQVEALIKNGTLTEEEGQPDWLFSWGNRS
jgi:hypothetical protein